MRRSDRLFDIIQALRSVRRPVTATELAERLEVSQRTVYRDIATLQSRRVPIEGEAGIGYLLRKGYDLPPLSFDTDEIEAIAVGVRMVQRLQDRSLSLAAQRVLDKITTSVAESEQDDLRDPALWVSRGSTPVAEGVDPSLLRHAIREALALRIDYVDAAGKASRRVVLPLAMVYYVDASLLAAWCERRSGFRHFRIDRIRSCALSGDEFKRRVAGLRRDWQAQQEP